ncbi:GSK3-beta interaction protein [Lamellibrachia satsuma]|nr:GSK3-beta interaction protein [Lamellibrachia satsuma]
MDDAGETIQQLLRIEADAAVQEVEFAVKHVEISKALPNTKEQVYMNLTTKEGQSFCVEFSVQGFRVVGKTFDKLEKHHETQYFETIYALLDHLKYGPTKGRAIAAVARM